MKFLNAADMTFKSTAELKALLREAVESLNEMDITSPEYEATISTIGIIKRTLIARQMRGPKLR